MMNNITYWATVLGVVACSAYGDALFEYLRNEWDPNLVDLCMELDKEVASSMCTRIVFSIVPCRPAPPLDSNRQTT